MLLRVLRAFQGICLLILSLGVALGCQLLFGDVEIGEPTLETNPAACAPGEFRCNGEYLLSCDTTAGWILASACATADRCDSRNKRCTLCQDGDYRCDGSIRQACQANGSGWRTLDNCESVELCSPTGCGPCTTPGEHQCSGADNRDLRRCGDNQLWELVDTCESSSLCAISLDQARVNPAWPGTCEEPGCLEPGKYRCDGQRLLRCPQDQTRWMEIDVCATEPLCVLRAEDANMGTTEQITTDMCAEGCPNAGAFRCDGMQLQRCPEDLTDWVSSRMCPPDTECNPTQGECTELCTPGLYQCNDAELRRCQPNRRWEVVERCATGALCSAPEDGTGGACLAPACPAGGDFKCEGLQLFECRADLTDWEPRQTCASAALCNELSKRCDAPACPAPNQYRCFEQELRQCNADQTAWVAPDGRTQPLICPAGLYCDNDQNNPGCKTECPSPTRCNGNVLQRCTPETGWVTQATCATDALCGCALQDPDDTGPLTDSCTLGVATNGCGIPACGGTTGPHFQCVGAMLEGCQAGRNGWETAATCGSAALCYPGAAPTFTAGYCATCPIAGEVQCTGAAPGSLRTCAANRRSWTTTQSCTLACIDNGTADYCAICNTGASQCMGATLQLCATDRRSWNTTQCLSAALCDAPNRQCDQCSATTCVDQELRRCLDNGQTLQTLLCPNVCDPVAGECDSCMAGRTWCEGTSLYRCSANGQTQSLLDTCATAALCDGPNGVCIPPACDVGDRQCTTAGQPQICNPGRTRFIDDGMLCATPQLCIGGQCRAPECTVNERDCDGAQPVLCNAGQTGFTPSGSACATADLCLAGVCTPPACRPAAVDCMGAQPRACNAGQTAMEPSGAPCPSAQQCNPATGTCRECAPEARRCSSTGVPQTCNATGSAWVSGTACSSAALCDPSTGTCLNCSPGSRQCSGAQPQLCTGMGWMDNGTACATSALCTNGTCIAPACAANAVQCMGDTLRTCRADRTAWTEQACGAGLCEAVAGQCWPECVPGSAAVCTADGRLQSCTLTGELALTTCVVPEICALGACVPAPTE